MELIVEYKDKKKALQTLFKENPEYFRILSRTSYPNDKFEYDQHNDISSYYKFVNIKKNDDILNIYGYKFIVSEGKLKSIKKPIYRIDNNFKLFHFGELFDSSPYALDFFDNYSLDNIKDKVSELASFIVNFIKKEYTWLRFYEEYNINMQIGTIVEFKLYSLEKCLKHMYPGFVYKEVKEKLYNKDRVGSMVFYYTIFRDDKKYFTNQNNANFDLFYDPIHGIKPDFLTAIHIAKIFDITINLSWSQRRLDEFIDEKSFTLNNLYFMINDGEIKVDKIFEEFSFSTSIKYPKSFKEIAGMGISGRNCVGGYHSKLNNGETCVYQWEDNITFELIKIFHEDYIFLEMLQIYGKYNSEVELSIKNKINTIIKNFNQSRYNDFDFESLNINN